MGSGAEVHTWRNPPSRAVPARARSGACAEGRERDAASYRVQWEIEGLGFPSVVKEPGLAPSARAIATPPRVLTGGGV